MQAVILAAGRGTRMKELTKDTPKPMLTVGGKNLLELKLAILPEEVGRLTSFLVTGFSNNTKCVSRPNVANTSRSASSAKLFEVSTSVVRFGIEFASEGWILEILFRASSSVRNRGESGKFPSIWISLSVKSIAS